MNSLGRLPDLDRLMRASHYPDHSLGMLLYALTYANAPRSILEIGYNIGYSALMLCAGMRDSGIRGRVVSVDIKRSDGGLLIRNRGFGDLHRFIQGDSVAVMSQVTTCMRRPIDLLFIDGDHSYEGCRRDWLAYKAHLDPQGIVLFHDNHLPAIKKVLGELEQSGEGWQLVDLKGHGGLTMARRQKAGAWSPPVRRPVVRNARLVPLHRVRASETPPAAHDAQSKEGTAQTS